MFGTVNLEILKHDTMCWHFVEQASSVYSKERVGGNSERFALCQYVSNAITLKSVRNSRNSHFAQCERVPVVCIKISKTKQ